ncbi:hypothetical protein C6T59_08925 [Burkholderia multivorans]|nr:hypothetical protein C6Q23_20835 [Burkholderia multivorans]PRG68259.1 hypothetical protein C6T59_08925 [Burkholderia multivorans]
MPDDRAHPLAAGARAAAHAARGAACRPDVSWHRSAHRRDPWHRSTPPPPRRAHSRNPTARGAGSVRPAGFHLPGNRRHEKTREPSVRRRA